MYKTWSLQLKSTQRYFMKSENSKWVTWRDHTPFFIFIRLTGQQTQDYTPNTHQTHQIHKKEVHKTQTQLVSVGRLSRTIDCLTELQHSALYSYSSTGILGTEVCISAAVNFMPLTENGDCVCLSGIPYVEQDFFVVWNAVQSNK